MKYSIGKPGDKKIYEVIEKNVLNGHTIFFDGQDYYCEVLNHNNVYAAIDTQFYSVPDGLYVFKNGIPYLQEE